MARSISRMQLLRPSVLLRRSPPPSDMPSVRERAPPIGDRLDVSPMVHGESVPGISCPPSTSTGRSWIPSTSDRRSTHLEFGVWEGESIRWWTENNREPGDPPLFHGFDSFEGLPVKLGGCPRGPSRPGARTDGLPTTRCHFVKGYFHQTFPGWLAGARPSRRLVVNPDADLYPCSTLLVLIQLMPLSEGRRRSSSSTNSTAFMHESPAPSGCLDGPPHETSGPLGRASYAGRSSPLAVA